MSVKRAPLWKVRKQIDDAILDAKTDLSVSRNATTVTVENDQGTDAAIPSADATTAGILTAAEFSRLQGIPAGGATGEVLTKTNGTDYNTEWAAASGGGGSTETKSGLATICDDDTSVTIFHGLTSTPTIGQIQVTPLIDSVAWDNADSTMFFISNITSTTFDIEVDVAPGRATTTNGSSYFVKFAWLAVEADDQNPADFIGVESHSGGNTINTDRRLGWRFTVGGSDLRCNILRVKPEGSKDEIVKLHKWSDSTLIAEARIEATSSAWLSIPVTDFVLEAGEDYIVSMQNDDAPSNRSVRANETNTFNSDVTYVESRTATSDVMPTLATGNTYTACDFGYSDT